ncbi:MAG: Helix-turn-helix domain, partial [Paenibacillus sp.]|nr:Helix-turn-helix domain [Paenibacillus sp.]
NATADRTGFKEASYFIRVFRKYWGVTPGEMKP